MSEKLLILPQIDDLMSIATPVDIGALIRVIASLREVISEWLDKATGGQKDN